MFKDFADGNSRWARFCRNHFWESEEFLGRPEIQDHKACKGLKVLRDYRVALKIPVLDLQKADGSKGFSNTEFHRRNDFVSVF